MMKALIELDERIDVGSVLDSRTWAVEYLSNVLRLRLIPPQANPSNRSAGSRSPSAAFCAAGVPKRKARLKPG